MNNSLFHGLIGLTSGLAAQLFLRGEKGVFENRPRLRQIARTILISAFALAQGLLYGLWETLPPGFTVGLLRSNWIRLLAVALCAGLAYSLFLLRQRRLAVYALLELFVGFATAWSAVRPLQDTVGLHVPQDMDRVLKIVAAVYLMIRALDNRQKAREQATVRAAAA